MNIQKTILLLFMYTIASLQASESRHAIDATTQTEASIDALDDATEKNKALIKNELCTIIDEALDTIFDVVPPEHDMTWKNTREAFIKKAPHCFQKNWCKSDGQITCCCGSITAPLALICFTCLYPNYIYKKNEQTQCNNGTFQCLNIACKDSIGQINTTTAITLAPCAIACFPCWYTDYIFMLNQNNIRKNNSYMWQSQLSPDRHYNDDCYIIRSSTR